MSYIQRIILFITISAFTWPFNGYSQYWKQTSFEGIYGLGASNLMSDVGSPDPDKVGIIGENFWLRPLSFRPVFTFGGRYMFNKRMGVTARLTVANLSAADAYGGYRQTNRITNTMIFELSGQYEYYVIKERRRQNVYRTRAYKWFNSINVPTYFFIGVGESLFFAKTQPDKRYINNPGYKDTFERPEKYNHTTPVIPVGIGVKFRLNKIIRFGVEAGFRVTFTDYLDEYKHVMESGYAWPDTYQFLLFTLNYKLKTGKSGLPRFRYKF
ncbi:MAG: hypothetical protein GXO79_15315 [Chlorobi bacterium]|nr:hypothetical protein [Chlorobiota bacterium]